MSTGSAVAYVLIYKGGLAPVRFSPRRSMSCPRDPGLRLPRDRRAVVSESAPAASLVGVPGDSHALAWVSSARPQCSPVCLRVSCSSRRAVGLPGDARTRVWTPRARPQFASVRPLQSTPDRSSSLRFVTVRAPLCGGGPGNACAWACAVRARSQQCARRVPCARSAMHVGVPGDAHAR
eukprot:2280632-Pleurochrysis_carterae.AAC.1